MPGSAEGFDYIVRANGDVHIAWRASRATTSTATSGSPNSIRATRGGLESGLPKKVERKFPDGVEPGAGGST
jgi:hypothetical protein